MSSTRVVVTGLGATSPVGGDVPTTWAALLAGTSGVRALTEDWASRLPVRIAARVAVEPPEVLERVKARRLDRSGQFALIAAIEAWSDSGLADPRSTLSGSESPSRPASAASRPCSATTTCSSRRARAGSPRLSIPMLMPNSPAANVGLAIGAKAGVHTPVSACASGNEAIAHGIDMIRLGRADVVVVGGTEAAIHPLPLAAFAQMMALSKRNDDPERASRPWDIDRDGFVLGEGRPLWSSRAPSTPRPAAHGLRRGRRRRRHRRLARHRPARPRRSGRHPRDEVALVEAELTARNIMHINAHATSTPQGDVAECLAITNALGRRDRPRRRHLDQVDDRPPARRGRCLGVDGDHPGAAPPRRTADDQPRQPRPGGQARHRHRAAQTAGRRHRRPQQLLRLRRHNVAIAFRSA